MSLYNALFGVNAAAPVLLAMLGIDANDVPRFRDCYLSDGKIAIHTRTGGGNRDSYENPERRKASYPDIYTTDEAVNAGPFNEDLRKLPGFLHDEDDDFDSTYATFYFDVPERFKHLIEKLPEGVDPAKRWQEAFEHLKTAPMDDPQVKKMTAVLEPMLKALEKGEGGTFTV